MAMQSINSLGQPVHPTEEGQKNFANWFGDSKVVDAKGCPLVVYHGTNECFDAFEWSMVGDAQEGKLFSGAGFYFADNEADARAYGEHVHAVYLKAERILDLRDTEQFKVAFADQVPRGQSKALGDMVREYKCAVASLRIEEVLVREDQCRKGFYDVQWKINGEWHSAWPRSPTSLELSEDMTGMTYARRHALPPNPDEFLTTAAYSLSAINAVVHQFDAVIGPGSIGHRGDEYVVFSPAQIKSVLNSGCFDSESASLTDHDPAQRLQRRVPSGMRM